MLTTLQISKRAQQPAPHRQVYIPPANNSTLAQNERLAHEQFIERNAWAQPQGPLHTLNTPNISHTPDWADQPFTGTGGATKHLIRNLSGQPPGMQRTGSPYATPLPQKRTPMDFSSSGTVAMGNSDGPENPPSSVLAAPPTSQRISLLNDQPSTSGGGNGPQTSPLTVPKHRHAHQPSNGRPSPAAPDRERELTGFRNISNSTIDAPSSSDPAMPHEVPPGPHAHLYAHNREIHPGQHHLQHHLPHLLRHEDSAPLQAFDTSAFHRHGEPHGPNGTPLRTGAISGLGQRGDSRTQTPASTERRREGFPFVAGFRPQEGGVFGASVTPGGSGAIGPGPS